MGALDVAISAVAYDDPLLKLHTFMGFGSPPAPGSAADAALEARTRLFYLEAFPKGAARRPDGNWMLFTGAVGSLAILVRNWPLRLMSASFLSILALNLLAGGVLFPAARSATSSTPVTGFSTSPRSRSSSVA